MTEDGSTILAGSTHGVWNVGNQGGLDFAACKLDADGTVLWKWQVIHMDRTHCSFACLLSFSLVPIERLCMFMADHIYACKMAPRINFKLVGDAVLRRRWNSASQNRIHTTRQGSGMGIIGWIRTQTPVVAV